MGSDLAEVQNVVDVAFPNMSSKIDEFAKSAASSFGLSETMAKNFTGLFGSMAQGFGYSEKAAYDMATTLTGLSGDVASFYNISQDEAFTRLKSVFTGETIALKSLGIVMTEAALDQYALANGFGRTVNQMSEAEKVMLRYSFVQDKLNFAAGDFARTSGSWANQVRLLRLQFDSLKATIGQGLIAALSPVIRVVNAVIGRLLSLANAVKAVFASFGGKGAQTAAQGIKSQAKALSDMGAGAGGAGKSLDGAGKSLGGAGDKAKKAAKEIKGVATGLDELNIINLNDADSGGGGGGGSGGGGSGGGSGGGGGYDVDQFDVDKAIPPTVEMDERLKGLLDRAKELRDLFMQGFKIGLGDTSVLNSIQNSIDRIKKSLKDIFTSSDVINAANRFADSFVLNLGKIAGSAASIGLTIADNLLGGMALFLEQNTSRIKDYIISMFDISSSIAEISGNFAVSVADIFTVFRSDTAKQITADIINIFATGFMGATELAGKFARDLISFVTEPIVQNSDKIKTAFNGILESVQIVTGTIADNFSKLVKKLNDFYDGHIKPFVDNMSKGFTEITGKVLDAFNTYMLPVIEKAAKLFKDFMDNTLQPLIDKFLDFAAKVLEAITAVWDKVLKPFVMYFIEKMMPAIANVLSVLVEEFFKFLKGVAEVIGHVLDALGGLIDFITGIFTGNWEKAWNGIKTFFSGYWKAMESIQNVANKAIEGLVKLLLETLKNLWIIVWTSIKDFATTVWTAIKNKATEIFTAIKEKLAEIWTAVKNKITEVWNSIKEWFVKTWNDIKEAFKTGDMVAVGKAIMENLLAGLKSVWESVKSWLKDAADFVQNVWNNISNMANQVASEAIGASSTMNSVGKGGGGSSFAIKGHASGGFPKSGNLFVANENGAPEMIGSWGGKSAVANNTQITQGIALAVNGAMQHALAPVVSAVDKLVSSASPPLAAAEAPHRNEIQEEVLKSAISYVNSNSLSSENIDSITELLKQIISLIESMDLTVNFDIREIKQSLANLDRRSGYTLRKA